MLNDENVQVKRKKKGFEEVKRETIDVRQRATAFEREKKGFAGDAEISSA